MCKTYVRLSLYCNHQDSELSYPCTDVEVCDGKLHVPIPFHTFCPDCLRVSELSQHHLRKDENPEPMKKAQGHRPFGRVFYSLLQSAWELGTAEKSLEGLFDPYEIGLLSDVHENLQADLLWRQSPRANPLYHPTQFERDTIIFVGQAVYAATIRGMEAARENGKARRLNLLASPVELDALVDPDCNVCYESFGEINEDEGVEIKPVRLSCGHTVLGN